MMKCLKVEIICVSNPELSCPPLVAGKEVTTHLIFTTCIRIVLLSKTGNYEQFQVRVSSPCSHLGCSLAFSCPTGSNLNGAATADCRDDGQNRNIILLLMNILTILLFHGFQPLSDITIMLLTVDRSRHLVSTFPVMLSCPGASHNFHLLCHGSDAFANNFLTFAHFSLL